MIIRNPQNSIGNYLGPYITVMLIGASDSSLETLALRSLSPSLSPEAPVLYGQKAEGVEL